ncbi:Transcriptional regulator TrmB [Nitrosotalea sinensis]|uniref:Transcriptional regulator TrmB n=1 Tax=Nitrosotalea sinensis TaxID=1499975 RepID=A0A2H1EE68_9ARCH|nr:helix-turn-helix domain-containing protein [Candidatus Nitrosotalea sinensis]SHO42695.1 Transcriptional regulator TrmB [Candidatus Nitrosotalea sinensis]
MNLSDKTRKALEKIGLTSYEIKTYSSLLKTGPITASDLSQKSGVPYSKIYEVLGTLEEKGWIGSDDSRPTQYFAKSPATAIQTSRQQFETEFKNNENIVLKELTPLYEQSGISEKPDIWIISGVINIATKILEMVDSCRSEVMIAIPKVAEELAKEALPKLRLLHDRGVDITILVSEDVDSETLKSLSRLATVKVKKGLFGGGIISDKRYVVLLLGEELGTTGTKEAVAIWADHSGLAGFAREYFEYLLKESKDVKSTKV